jgi:Cu(I)/Ag(I) efflux system membrane protein CusA/SilA
LNRAIQLPGVTNAWIYVDIQNIDVGTYVQRAQRAVAENVTIPTGYSVGWSGQ